MNKKLFVVSVATAVLAAPFLATPAFAAMPIDNIGVSCGSLPAMTIGELKSQHYVTSADEVVGCLAFAGVGQWFAIEGVGVAPAHLSKGSFQIEAGDGTVFYLTRDPSVWGLHKFDNKLSKS